MQMQADLLGRDVEVADVAEISALGAAQLGWQWLDPTLDWAAACRPRTFSPTLDDAERTPPRPLGRRGRPGPPGSPPTRRPDR